MALNKDDKKKLSRLYGKYPGKSSEIKETAHNISGIRDLLGRAKSEALKKKKLSTRQKRFSKYLKTHPSGTMKGDRKAMFEHNRMEYDKPDYD